MPKVMLINVTHSEESRVGILNDRVLESFEIESLSRAHLKGNIYKGVVHRIHPALEAAFVDIGAERDAFLPLDEVCFNNLDDEPKASRNGNGSGRSQLRIRDVLRPGQEVLVQITKEQFANKPPTLTTFYSLPGRYLVLLPGSEDTGISRRIEGEERDRLRKVVDDLKPESGYGLIVRTVAGLEDNGRELSRDLDYLKRLWGNVKEASHGRAAPSLVYREHDIVQRAIRDFYTPDISEIYIDDEEVYERARDFLRAIMPGSESVLRLYRGEQPLFSAFSVEEQIESVFGRRVRLKSGGSIVIDGTEALTAIDVNSGGAVRGANPEETAFKTNREAAAEVARQLRLRDIGGIIVVDFIDMRDPRHNREIEQLMRSEMKIDKARHETSRLSSLGLMQISRQRLRPAAGATSHTTCPLCQGYGSVRTHASAALGAIRKIHDRLSLGDVETMTVTLPADVGLYVLNQQRNDLADLESRYESKVEIRLDGDLLPHEIETQVKERSRTGATSKPAESGGIVEAKEGDRASDGTNGAKKRKRRRRKRSSRGGAENGAAAGDESSQAATPNGNADERDSSGEATPNDQEEKPVAAETSETSERESPKREDGAAPRSRRSRGRRGGRRRRGGSQSAGDGDTRSGDRAEAHQATAPSGEKREAAEAAPRSTDRPEPSRTDRRPGDKPGPAEPTARPDTPKPAEPSPAPQASPASGERPAAGGDAAAARSFGTGADRPRTTQSPAPAPVPSSAAPKSEPAPTGGGETDVKPARKATAKKTATKKAATKKATTKKAAAKKTTKKAATKKTAAKKTTKKAATKETTKKTTKKTPTKKAAPAPTE